MKVLFLSQIVPYPPNNGVLQRGYNLIRELHKYNELYLMAFVHPDVPGFSNIESLIEESRRELGSFCKMVEYYTVWPKKSTLHRKFGVLWGYLSRHPFDVLAYRSNAFRKRVREIIKSEKIDLIHCDTVALAQFIPDDSNLPRVVTHHNIESSLMQRRANIQKNSLAKHYLLNQTEKMRTYEMAECSKFDCNIVVSEIDNKDLQKLIPGIKTAIIPNGTDTSFFQPKPEREKNNSIVHVGRLRSANLDSLNYFLSEIWPLIKSRNSNVLLKIVGGDVPKDIDELGRKEENITVTGFVEDILPHIWEASIIVVPIRVGGGTRLKVLNAMAAGKAIVSTSIGCEGINVKPDETILIADDPADFADKTCSLLKDSQKRAALGRAARALAENEYSWEIIGGKMQDMYENVKDGNEL